MSEGGSSSLRASVACLIRYVDMNATAVNGYYCYMCPILLAEV
jgi:hypothetical protein